MAQYRRGWHTIYDIQYHLVWVTKYRYHVLTGEVAVRGGTNGAIRSGDASSFWIAALSVGRCRYPISRRSRGSMSSRAAVSQRCL